MIQLCRGLLEYLDAVDFLDVVGGNVTSKTVILHMLRVPPIADSTCQHQVQKHSLLHTDRINKINIRLRRI